MRLALLVLLLLGCGPVGSSGRGAPPAPAAPASARGLVLVIGDGFGPGQLALLLAARPEGAMATLLREGEVGLVDPAPFEALVNDSAAGGTALATGVRTRPRMLAVDPEGRGVETLLEAGRRLGRGTGMVTTADLTDATPAAFLSHSPSRSDAAEIAAQILARPPTIAIGGGAKHFPDAPPSILALAPADLPFLRREARPPLAELTRRALEALDGEAPYVLVVEAALIDKACHAHLAPELLRELIDLDEALAELLPRARAGELLLVVTADHETGGFGFTYLPHPAGPGPTALPNGKSWNPRGDFVSAADLEALSRGETPPSITWATFTHTSALIPLVAMGPGAESFRGFRPQWEVGGLLREAIGAGPARLLE